MVDLRSLNSVIVKGNCLNDMKYLTVGDIHCLNKKMFSTEIETEQQAEDAVAAAVSTAIATDSKPLIVTNESRNINKLPKQDDLNTSKSRDTSFPSDSSDGINKISTVERESIAILPDSISSYLNASTFDLISDCTDNQSYSNSSFINYCTLNNIYVIPDDNYSHLKSKSNRDILNEIKIYSPYKIKTWNDLSKLYFKSLFKFSSNLRPIESHYLKNLELILSRNPTLKGTPASSLFYNYNKNHSLSKICYSYSNGLNDLIFFLKSKFFKLAFDFKYDASSLGKKELKLTWFYRTSSSEVRNLTVNIDISSSSYEVSTIKPDYSLKSNNSILYKSSSSKVLSDLFDFNIKDFHYTPYQTLAQTKHIFTAKKSGDCLMLDGFSTRFSTSENVTFDFSNVDFISSLISVMSIDSLGYSEFNISPEDENIIDIYSALSTNIRQYVTSYVDHSDSKAFSISLEGSISRKDGLTEQDELHSLFRKYVNLGLICPITPAHYSFYFRSSIIKRFSEFVVLGAMSNPSVNIQLKSLLPFIDNESKQNFKKYALNRDLLHLQYYMNKTNFDFQNVSVSIHFEELLVEMFVRTMLIKSAPPYFPLISRGQWSCTDGHSDVIRPANLNPVLVKFKLNDFNSNLNVLFQDITLRSPDFRVPYQFKSQTRLVESCPDMIERFTFYDGDSNILSSDLFLNDMDFDYRNSVYFGVSPDDNDDDE